MGIILKRGQSQHNKIQRWATCWNFQSGTLKQLCKMCGMFQRNGQQPKGRARQRWKVSKWDCQE